MRGTSSLALGASVLALATAAVAGPEKISFPEGYSDSFVEYIRIDRPDRKTIRFMYVNPEAHQAAEPGQPLPDGTVLIMEDRKALLGPRGEPRTDAEGRLVPTDEVTNLFVMEKQPGWGGEYPPEVRNGEWEYAWFLPDGTRKVDAKFDGCFGCHQSRAGRDYTFTFYKYVLDTKQ